MSASPTAILAFPIDPANTLVAQAQLDQVVAHWLNTKEGHTGSAKTRRAYADTLASFRAHLHAVGRDLAAPEEVIVAQAQDWAALGDPALATYNQRLAIVSSFLKHCDKHRLLPPGCAVDLRRVDRRKVHSYAAAHPLTPEAARADLARIDRTTPAGLRDYALLLVALTTGRRVAELAAWRWGSCTLSGTTITITTPRAKGGKQMVDTLSPRATDALLVWLQHYYGGRLAAQPPPAPLWVSLAHNDSQGQPLAVGGLQALCRQHLGCHFHALRHTFARSMEDAGAKVSEIQARLGHESLDTTGRYLAALRRAENPQAAALDALFTEADMV